VEEAAATEDAEELFDLDEDVAAGPAEEPVAESEDEMLFESDEVEEESASEALEDEPFGFEDEADGGEISDADLEGADFLDLGDSEEVRVAAGEEDDDLGMLGTEDETALPDAGDELDQKLERAAALLEAADDSEAETVLSEAETVLPDSETETVLADGAAAKPGGADELDITMDNFIDSSVFDETPASEAMTQTPGLPMPDAHEAPTVVHEPQAAESEMADFDADDVTVMPDEVTDDLEGSDEMSLENFIETTIFEPPSTPAPGPDEDSDETVLSIDEHAVHAPSADDDETVLSPGGGMGDFGEDEDSDETVLSIDPNDDADFDPDATVMPSEVDEPPRRK